MRWHVNLETIWVFNSLTKTMNCVFFMKRVIFRKTFSKMESKKLDKRKKKSE